MSGVWSSFSGVGTQMSTASIASDLGEVRRRTKAAALRCLDVIRLDAMDVRLARIQAARPCPDRYRSR